ncbi:MAG: hypothetical protein HQ488_04910 [Parcubacteria group bacterium]|nr:hypothetical protein [Parcubacteria group bacterium]
MLFSTVILIALHTFLAWILIESFVNLSHKLARSTYVLTHYAVVVGTFSTLFAVYFRYFSDGVSVFWVVVTSLTFLLFYELVVFRYLYSGERWFLNWTDWIVPVFLSMTTIYSVGRLMT